MAVLRCCRRHDHGLCQPHWAELDLVCYWPDPRASLHIWHTCSHGAFCLGCIAANRHPRALQLGGIYHTFALQAYLLLMASAAPTTARCSPRSAAVCRSCVPTALCVHVLLGACAKPPCALCPRGRLKTPHSPPGAFQQFASVHQCEKIDDVGRELLKVYEVEPADPADPVHLDPAVPPAS